jgi:hypothetical protein
MKIYGRLNRKNGLQLYFNIALISFLDREEVHHIENAIKKTLYKISKLT